MPRKYISKNDLMMSMDMIGIPRSTQKKIWSHARDISRKIPCRDKPHIKL